MDGIFTLPYSEFEVINIIQKHFKKKDGFSVYIPTSRQQKGVDFIVHNCLNNKILRFQVKSSRYYFNEPCEKNGELKIPEFKYSLWFRNFIDKFNKSICDYYVLFGLYPVYSTKNNIKSDFWKTILLCYSSNEMYELLNKIKTVRELKPDRFFSFGFNNGNEIFNVRGFIKNQDASKHLLKNKISTMINI